MRISDWSSDVCSSDLDVGQLPLRAHRADRHFTGRRLQHRTEPRREIAGLRAAHGHLVRAQRHAVGVRGRGVRAEDGLPVGAAVRSEEHTSELQSLMRISYAVFCLKKKKNIHQYDT